MTKSSPQREFAERIVAQLRAAGHEALWAGGCVRDELLGRKPKDYDVATSALPDEVRGVFGKQRTIAIGAAFGVITVLGPKEMGQIEVATFRADAGYSDGRRPDDVRFTGAQEDASRRDFTINGLFYDTRAGEVVDYVGGQADLEAKVVRAIGDPEKRFAEDKLRMLRAVRFAATLGFDIDRSTADAIRAHAAELDIVSAERIGAEVQRMLLDANRARALALLREVGLLPVVFPELAAATCESLDAAGSRLSGLENPSLGLAVATLLFGNVVPADAASCARQLRFTKRDGEHAAWLLANVAGVAQIINGPWSVVQPVLAHPDGKDAVTLHEAIVGGPDAASRACRDKLALPRETLDPTPLVTGGDLIRHGCEPRARFGTWLQQVRDAQLDGQIGSKVEALAFVDQLSAQ